MIIGADTVVAVGDLILEKPKDRAAGKEMLSLLSGRGHLVLTGLTVLYSSSVITDVVTTEVFSGISAKTKWNYIGKRENQRIKLVVMVYRVSAGLS